MARRGTKRFTAAEMDFFLSDAYRQSKQQRTSGLSATDKRQDAAIAEVAEVVAEDQREEVMVAREMARTEEEALIDAGFRRRNSMFRVSNLQQGTVPALPAEPPVFASPWPVYACGRRSNGADGAAPTGWVITPTTSLTALSPERWLTNNLSSAISPGGYNRGKALGALGAQGAMIQVGESGTSPERTYKGKINIKQINYEFLFRVDWSMEVAPTLDQREGQKVRFCILEFENADSHLTAFWTAHPTVEEVFSEYTMGTSVATVFEPQENHPLMWSKFRKPRKAGDFTAGQWNTTASSASISNFVSQLTAANSADAYDLVSTHSFPKPVVNGSSPHNFRCVHDETFHFNIIHVKNGEGIDSGDYLKATATTYDMVTKGVRPHRTIDPGGPGADLDCTKYGDNPLHLGIYRRHTSVKLGTTTWTDTDASEQTSSSANKNLYADKFYLPIMISDSPYYRVHLLGMSERQIFDCEWFPQRDLQNEQHFEDYDKDGKTDGQRVHSLGRPK